MKKFKETLHNVKAFAFDVDGVLAKQIVTLYPDGDMMRTMNTRDGMAINMAIKQGFPVAIITGGASESLKIRFNNLGVTDVYLRSMDKWDDFEDFIYKYGLDPNEVLYMGDDIPDLAIMERIDYTACPSDACVEVKAASGYISNIAGGEGAGRDVIEQVMRAQGKWYNPNNQESKKTEKDYRQ